MSDISRQNAVNTAKTAYSNIERLIRKLSDYAAKSEPTFSFEIAMKQFDFILQMILLKVALEDELVLYTEINFIKEVRKHGDLLEYINLRMKNNSLNWTDLEWNYLEKFEVSTCGSVLAVAESLTEDVRNNFIIHFAAVEYVVSKSYIDSIKGNIDKIIFSLSVIDGDKADSQESKAEVLSGQEYTEKLIVKKWKFYVDKYRTRKSENNRSENVRVDDNSLEANFLKRKQPSKPSYVVNHLDNQRQFQSAVVYIETDKGAGTGLFINDSGSILTCAHVIENASKIFVRVTDINGKSDVYKAKILRRSNNYDLAVIKIDGNYFYYVDIETTESNALLGEDVVLYGFPFGKNINDNVMHLNLSYSKGYVSSTQIINGQERTFLDISAKAGNSGSPVVNVRTGKVIGVLKGSIIGGNNDREEINFMIPIKYMKKLFE